MVRHFLTTICLGFIVGFTFAQPTLSSTDILPRIGEQFDFRVFDASVVSTPDTGANQSWDYSGLVTTSNSSIFVNSPINLPNGGDYPQANLVLEQDSTYLYYKGNTNVFSLYGFEATTNQAIYTDPDDQLEFPLTYLSNGVDSFSGTFDVTIPNLGQFLSYRTGVTHYTANGYGTLILPNGTFNDVLKVTVTSEQQDSIRLIIFDTLINSTITIHQWYVKGTHTPIMTLSETVTEIQPLPIYLGNYYDQIVGIENAKAVDEQFTLSYSEDGSKVKLVYYLSTAKDVSLSLIDMQGRVVGNLLNDYQQAGEQELTIPVNEMSKGVYLIQGKLGNQIFSEKLLIP